MRDTLIRARTIASFSLPTLRSRFISSTTSPPPQFETDELGIPLKPTWSVQKLLSSYPPPTLEPEALIKLHKLAALQPPPTGSEKFETLRSELGDLIKVVEAVKKIKIDVNDEDGIPDGRIWQQGRGMTFEESADQEEPKGRELLQHASRSIEGLYVVDSSRKR